MLDPKHLLWLAEIIDLGSMSRAAQKLHITQPTLTRAVQVIEDRVGGPVLRREHNGVRPTRIGERLADVGRKVVLSRLEAEDVIDLWRQGLAQELRIGVGPMLAISIMGRFLSEMLETRLRYSLKVVSATASRLIARLNEDELDVVLAPTQINLLQDDLVQDHLFDDELSVYAGKKNPLARSQSPIGLEDLSGQTWVAVGVHSAIFGSSREALSSIGLGGETAKISFTGDITMAVEIVNRTTALCILPKKLAQRTASLTQATELEIEVPLPKRDIAFWCKKADRDRPDILDFRKRVTQFVLREGLDGKGVDAAVGDHRQQ